MRTCRNALSENLINEVLAPLFEKEEEEAALGEKMSSPRGGKKRNRAWNVAEASKHADKLNCCETQEAEDGAGQPCQACPAAGDGEGAAGNGATRVSATP